MIDLWTTANVPLCARCHLELFPEELFICVQCRLEEEGERVATFVEVCVRAQRMDMRGPRVRARWRIG